MSLLSPSWVFVHLCVSPSTVLSSLCCCGDKLDRGSDRRHGTAVRLGSLWQRFSNVFHSLSSYRAKPATNSNDTGGAEESDLEKMKQVNVFTALARGKWLHMCT